MGQTQTDGHVLLFQTESGRFRARLILLITTNVIAPASPPLRASTVNSANTRLGRPRLHAAACYALDTLLELFDRFMDIIIAAGSWVTGRLSAITSLTSLSINLRAF